jgi:hypothetical protein
MVEIEIYGATVLSAAFRGTFRVFLTHPQQGLLTLLYSACEATYFSWYVLSSRAYL